MQKLPDFDPGFSTPRMTELWSGEAKIRRWCEAETALAHAAASVGLIPQESATAIEASCVSLAIEPAFLLDAGWTAGTPILVLLTILRQTLPPGTAQHLHFGATSQDIIDTGSMLQARDSLVELGRLLEAMADGLASAIEKHPHDFIIGRTLMQPALPTRFAWRVAGWLDPVLDVLEQIAAARLPVQLGGPVGDLAPFGESASKVVDAFATRLGLSSPHIPWHADRRPIVSSVALADRAASVAEKIAADLILLSQKELAELRIPAGGSSSMPHKQNAMLAVHAVAAARACHGVSSIVLQAPPHELERAAGSWQAEWFALPLAFQASGAALDATRRAVCNMVFDAKRALANIDGASLPDPSAADRLVLRVVERYRQRGGQRRS